MILWDPICFIWGRKPRFFIWMMMIRCYFFFFLIHEIRVVFNLYAFLIFSYDLLLLIHFGFSVIYQNCFSCINLFSSEKSEFLLRGSVISVIGHINNLKSMELWHQRCQVIDLFYCKICPMRMYENFENHDRDHLQYSRIIPLWCLSIDFENIYLQGRNFLSFIWLLAMSTWLLYVKLPLSYWQYNCSENCQLRCGFTVNIHQHENFSFWKTASIICVL